MKCKIIKNKAFSIGSKLLSCYFVTLLPCYLKMPHTKTSRSFLLFCTICLVFVISSCKTLKIERPAENYQTVSYSPQYSYINIPVDLEVKALKKLINREISGTIYADTSFEDHDEDNLMLIARKGDSIDLNISRNQLSYRVPLKIWLRKRFKAGILGFNVTDIKDATAEVALKFKTSVTINRDWSVSTFTQSDGYEWITAPQVMIGVTQIPLPFFSDLLIQSNLPTVAKEIDNSIKQTLSIKTMMNDAWTRMQKPVLLSTDYPLWMKITPVEVSTVPIRGTSAFIRHTIGLKALVQLSFGDEPSHALVETMPPLKITSTLPEKFNINVSMDFPFPYLNKLAQTQLSGYTMAYKNYKLTVSDVALYGQGEYLIVAVMVDGSVKGTIYLKGIPVFDRNKLTIRFEDLDFSFATRNVLQKTASWIFHSGLLQKMAQNLEFPLEDKLKSAREEIAACFEKNQSLSYFRIKGEVGKLEPDRILISPGSVRACFVFEGKVWVSINTD